MSQSLSETTQKPIALLSRPYTERQKIVIVKDGDLQAAKEQAASGGVDLDASDYGQLAAVGFLFGGPIGALVAGAGGAVFEKISEYRDKRKASFAIVSRSEVAELDFPPGHPFEKVLYIGHPLVPRLYYPAADFHRSVLEHKLAEAVRILVALGATRLEVRHQLGWSNEMAAKMSLPVGMTGVMAHAKGGVTRKSSAGLLFKADYHSLEGKRKRTLPRGLVWYREEPQWQLFVDEARRGRTKKFSLGVKYSDSFGVNAEIKAEALAFKIELGGEFEDFQETEWCINAKFADPPKAMPEASPVQ
jgi:hypothetical protein